MSNTTHNGPTAKQGRRKAKAESRNPKPGKVQSAQPDSSQIPPAQPQVPPPAPLQDAVQLAAPPAPPQASAPVNAAPNEAAASVEAAPSDSAPVSFQTIANAYSDLTLKSLEETRSYVEQLSGVRSLDKAIELQNEFARRAYQTFVTASQRIRGLHGEMVKQAMKPLDDLVNKARRDAK